MKAISSHLSVAVLEEIPGLGSTVNNLRRTAGIEAGQQGKMVLKGPSRCSGPSGSTGPSKAYKAIVLRQKTAMVLKETAALVLKEMTAVSS
jgi:hypothetical protein